MSTRQPNALRLAHTLSGGKLIDDSTEWADTLHAAAAELLHQHARIEELEEQLSAIGVALLRKHTAQADTKDAAPAQEGWCDGCNPDNCVGCGPATPAQVQPEPHQGEQS